MNQLAVDERLTPQHIDCRVRIVLVRWGQLAAAWLRALDPERGRLYQRHAVERIVRHVPVWVRTSVWPSAAGARFERLSVQHGCVRGRAKAKTSRN